jgi:hypothetical protein
MLTPERRAAIIAETKGKPGPTGDDFYESLAVQRGNNHNEILTTRPATVAAALEDESIPVVDVVELPGGEWRIVIAADHYRPGDVLRAYSRRVYTDDQRAAMAERMHNMRRVAPQDAPGAPEPTPDMAAPAPAVPGAPGAAE